MQLGRTKRLRKIILLRVPKSRRRIEPPLNRPLQVDLLDCSQLEQDLINFDLQ